MDGVDLRDYSIVRQVQRYIGYSIRKYTYIKIKLQGQNIWIKCIFWGFCIDRARIRWGGGFLLIFFRYRYNNSIQIGRCFQLVSQFVIQINELYGKDIFGFLDGGEQGLWDFYIFSVLIFLFSLIFILFFNIYFGFVYWGWGRGS